MKPSKELFDRMQLNEFDVEVKKYSPDQPRDDHGRFGSGSGDSKSDLKPYQIPEGAVGVSRNNLVSATFPHVGLSEKAKDTASRLKIGKSVTEGNATVTEATYTGKDGRVYDLKLTETVRKDTDTMYQTPSVQVDGKAYAYYEGKQIANLDYGTLANPSFADTFETPVARIGHAGTVWDFQRQGINGAMLELARSLAPMPVLHSDSLSDEGGKLFAQVHKYSPDQERDDNGRFAGGGLDFTNSRILGNADVENAITALANGQKVSVTREQALHVVQVAYAYGQQSKEKEDPIDITKMHVEGTNFFDGEHFGLSRSDMPQIPPRFLPLWENMLTKQGVEVSRETVSPDSLQPIQKEIGIMGVGASLSKVSSGTESPLIVSKDDYIMDGHHRWAAAVLDGSSVPIMRVNMSHEDLITNMHQFNKSEGIAPRGLGEFDGKLRKAYGSYIDELIVALFKYAPDQPRDDHGRFATENGSSNDTGSATTEKVVGQDLTTKIKTKDLPPQAKDIDGRDKQLEYVAHAQGFDGHAQTITKEELAKMDNPIIVYRGIKPYFDKDGKFIEGDAIVQNFISGEYFGGLGGAGNGTYWSTEKEYASSYADNGIKRGDAQSAIITAVLDPSIKIAPEGAGQWESGRKAATSTLLAMEGYDGKHGYKTATPGDIYITYNRTAIKVVTN